VANWAVGTCLVSWALSACLSPTLPLPPPGGPTVAELSADRRTVRIVGGGALRGATVMLLNEDTQDGVFTTAGSDGLYTVEKFPVDLSQSATNAVEIWQTYGSDSSEPFVVHVPKGVAFGAPPVDDASAPTEAGPIDAGASDAGE
jgi:hypothetical protein